MVIGFFFVSKPSEKSTYYIILKNTINTIEIECQMILKSSNTWSCKLKCPSFEQLYSSFIK